MNINGPRQTSYTNDLTDPLVRAGDNPRHPGRLPTDGSIRTFGPVAESAGQRNTGRVERLAE